MHEDQVSQTVGYYHESKLFVNLKLRFPGIETRQARMNDRLTISKSSRELGYYHEIHIKTYTHTNNTKHQHPQQQQQQQNNKNNNMVTAAIRTVR